MSPQGHVHQYPPSLFPHLVIPPPKRDYLSPTRVQALSAVECGDYAAILIDGHMPVSAKFCPVPPELIYCAAEHNTRSMT
jgi:hypothetical protein